MNVYVVMENYDHEAGTVHSVYTSVEAAGKAVEKLNGKRVPYLRLIDGEKAFSEWYDWTEVVLNPK